MDVGGRGRTRVDPACSLCSGRAAHAARPGLRAPVLRRLEAELFASKQREASLQAQVESARSMFEAVRLYLRAQCSPHTPPHAPLAPSATWLPCCPT